MTDREAGFGLAYLIIELFLLPGLLTAAAARLGLDSATINFIYYCTNFCACCLIFHRFLRENLVQAGKRLWPFVLSVGVGFVCYQAVNFAAAFVLKSLMPSFSNVNDASIAQMVSAHPVMMLLGTAVLVPVAEECLFRGVLFGKLRSSSRAGAYCVSILCFCAVHVMGYIGAYEPAVLDVCFVQYIPPGLILAGS